jgi:HK97 family phage prohead protease
MLDFPDRLITLSDGRSGLRGRIQVEASEPAASDGKPIIQFTASDESLDRYDEIIAASGWKLENYQRNPVFQNAHQYGDIIFTLGRAIATEVRTVAGRKALVQQVEFACDVNPMAKIAYGLYKGKFLTAVSVGFVPIRWENGTEQSGYRRKFVEQELLEVSAVAIPANPNALALGLKSGAVEKSDLRDLADLIHKTLDPFSVAASKNQPPISPAATDLTTASQLLTLAKDLRNLLKL